MLLGRGWEVLTPLMTKGALERAVGARGRVVEAHWWEEKGAVR